MRVIDVESAPMVKQIVFSRIWQMPAKYTFAMPAVREILERLIADGKTWIDPFCGRYSPAQLRNDFDRTVEADAHMDGHEWLTSLATDSADGCLFDPPYSVHQALRIYKSVQGGTVGRDEYQAKCLDEVARIVKTGGLVVRFGWNSQGAGKGRGFKLLEVMLLCHGKGHNDTIITVESKVEEVPYQQHNSTVSAIRAQVKRKTGKRLRSSGRI